MNKGWLKNPLLGATFIVTLVGILSQQAFLAVEPEFPRLNISENKASPIDRILPSKPGDLFVQLRNGLTVLIREKRDSKIVSCQILVKTGSIYEDEWMYGGISHYLEHLVSGGTTRSFKEDEAKRMLRGMGGATNAYTGYDHTTYFINTTSRYYKKALKLLVSFVSEPLFPPAEVSREKAVIQQEIRLGENDPQRQLWQLFMKTAYMHHPVRNPVIGYEDVFVTLKRDDIVRYWRQRYGPQNMIISVVGDVSAIEVLEEVIDLAGALKRRPQKPVIVPAEPPQQSPRRAEKVFAPARLTSMMVGFPSVSLTDPDLFPLDVLSIVLGQGTSSRLSRRLKDEEGLVLSVTSSNWTPAYLKGTFMISMKLKEKNIPKALESLWEELERIKEKPVSPKELEKAKKNVLADYVFGKQRAEDMAQSLATSFLYTGDPYFDERYVKGIRDVSLSGLQRVAQRYFSKERVNIAILKPAKKGAMAGQRKAAAEAPSEGGIRHLVLPNGLICLLKRNSSVPVVTVQLFGKGGLRFEPPGKAGISSFTFRLLKKGTLSRSKEDIAEAIEGVGGSLSSGSGQNSYYVTASVLKEDLELALELVADVIRNPAFPQEEIERQRHETLMALEKRDERWEAEIMHLFRQHYYKSHPYRNDVLGTIDSVKAFGREELVQFYRKVAMPNNAVLAVFGDIQPDEVLEKIERFFGSWKRGTLLEPDLPDESFNLRRPQRIKKVNDKSSAALFIGTNGMTISNPERAAMDVIDAVLSGIGYPSGWLHDALRGDQEGLVYVVHAFPKYGIDGGFFGVLTQTTLGNLDRVEKIINQNLDRIQKEPLGLEELEQAKEMILTMHEMGLETNADQARSAALNEVLGLGYDFDRRYPEMVEEVTAQEVLAVARRFLSPRLTVLTIPRRPEKAGIPRVGSGREAGE